MCMQCVAQSTPMVAASFGLLRRRALVAHLKLAADRLPWRRRPVANPGG